MSSRKEWESERERERVRVKSARAQLLAKPKQMIGFGEQQLGEFVGRENAALHAAFPQTTVQVNVEKHVPDCGKSAPRFGD